MLTELYILAYSKVEIKKLFEPSKGIHWEVNHEQQDTFGIWVICYGNHGNLCFPVITDRVASAVSLF